MHNEPMSADELIEFILHKAFRKFFFEVTDKNKIKVTVEREEIEKQVAEHDAQLIVSTLHAAADRVRHYTDDKAYNDAIDNAIVAILAPLDKTDKAEGNS